MKELKTRRVEKSRERKKFGKMTKIELRARAKGIKERERAEGESEFMEAREMQTRFYIKGRTMNDSHSILFCVAHYICIYRASE